MYPATPPPVSCCLCDKPLTGQCYPVEDRGLAHPACLPWEEMSAPCGEDLLRLKHEIKALRIAIASKQRVMRAIEKLQREWPKDGKARMAIVAEMVSEDSARVTIRRMT